jgi:alcohol dehydrogenase
MKAVLFRKFGESLSVEKVPDPAPPPDGVVIRVEATGLCRSDWHGWMGHDADIRHLPHIPGHELAGVVEAVGPLVRQRQPGERVTVPFAVGCGVCPQCAAGQQQVCDNYYQPGFTGWGSFAEYVAIPHADVNLVPLPEVLSSVAAASLGCRFITAFRAVVHQGRVKPGQWLAIHGCGGVGLAAVMIGRALGAQVLAVDVKADALVLAKSLGAEVVLNGHREADVVSSIRQATGGGAQVSLDALGSVETCRNSILGLRKQGRHVQVGLMVAGYQDAPVPMNVVIARELELAGSHGMQAHACEPLLGMILAGKLHPERLVRQTIALEGAPAAMAAMGEFRGEGITVINKF